MNTNKKLLFKEKARTAIGKGVNIVSNAVSCTMGPKGKCVVIENPGSVPVVTKDGISIARSISLKDQFENLGAQMTIDAGLRTLDQSGDGTSTCTILLQSLYEHGLKMISGRFSPTEIKKGIDWSVKEIVKNLEKNCLKVEEKEQIIHVGTVSSNGDRSVGELISEAYDKVGENGTITVEEAKGYETTLEVVDGMQVDRGYLSSYFVTNNEKMTAELVNPLVLVTNQKMNTMEKMIHFLEQVHMADKPVLIIADEIGPEVLQALTVNKLQNVLQVCAVMAPGFGDSREDYLEDIATLTGAKVVAPNTGLKMEDIDLNDSNQDIVGSCKKVVVGKHKTMLVGKRDENIKNNVMERIKDLEALLEDPGLEEYDRDLIKSRLGKLSGGVAILRVGGATEIELKERADRVDDALCAVSVAMKGGITAGGGVALLRASQDLPKLPEGSSQAFKSGVDIVKDACEAPARKIIENADLSPELIIDKIKNNKKNKNWGFNSAAEEYQDLVENGIIDPVLVPKTALENAASVAGLMLTIDAAVVEEDLDSISLNSVYGNREGM